MKYTSIKWQLTVLLTQVCLIAAFSQANHYETAVYADNDWRYFIGNSEPPNSWRAVGFDDTAWELGAGSIGYGDDDDNTIIDPVTSIYMRQQFTITDKSKIDLAVLYTDFDDGFVAYLNGTEIARINVAEDNPTYTTEASDLREAQMYTGGFPLAVPLDDALIADLLIDGTNVIAVQTVNFGGSFSSDMTSLYWLILGINDNSNDYGPLPNWFPFPDFETPLPIIKIDTGGEYIPDEPEVTGQMGIIWNSDGSLNSNEAPPNEFLGDITIERRGQSSLGLFPKNGFSIETKDENGEDMDVEFLNFPPEEDWILHGPYSDKSLLRNIIAMEIARSMGQYASRTRLVELIINEHYEGIYVLMERIKRDEDRVDIANLRAEDISGDELTGGYIFKIDKGPADWISQYDIVNNPGQKLGFQYVSPRRSQIQPEQEAYIQSYVDSFEMAMVFPDGTFGGKRYDEYIDLESFADHFLISELTKEVDAYRFSSYYYKDKDSNGGLLKAGPIWDFNLAFGNANYCNAETDFGWMYDEHCDLGNPFWWGNMMEDAAFRNMVKCRWEHFRSEPLQLATIFAFIDQQVALMEPALARNFQRWPVLNQFVWPNVVLPGTYEGEIDYLKEFIAARIAWMDDNIFGECINTATYVTTTKSNFRLFPNPASGSFIIQTDAPLTNAVNIQIFDFLGRNVNRSMGYNIWPANSSSITIDIQKRDLLAGCYLVQIISDGRLLSTHRLIVE